MKKSKSFCLRFYGDEVDELERKFKSSKQKTMNVFIKNCIKKSKWEINENRSFDECRRLFSYISNNLNQLSKKANIENKIDVYMLEELIKIRQLLISLLDYKGNLK